MTMNSSIKMIVHNASMLVFVEAVWRVAVDSKSYWAFQGANFATFYFACIAMQWANFKDNRFVKHSSFRLLLSFSHGIDGLSAGAIGLSIYFRSKLGLIISLALMCKFGLLSLLNRMILAKAVSASPFETMLQTTKSFLHHVASFLFIIDPTEVLITSAWRTLSMTSHALLVLRGHIDPKVIRRISWVLTYMRMVFLTAFIAALCMSSDLRASFGYSAVGHIAYMTVRLVPLLQTGTIYIPEDEREEWGLLDDGTKIKLLLQGKHPLLAIEVAQLCLLTVVFAFLRLTILVREVNVIEALPTWQSWLFSLHSLSH